MNLKFSFPAPRWVAAAFMPDLLRRADLFGRASRSWRHGKAVSGSVEVTSDEGGGVWPEVRINRAVKMRQE
jgi:hypothetical protein